MCLSMCCCRLLSVTLTHVLFFFFFQCDVRVPALHSFPTRRSSDLVVDARHFGIVVDAQGCARISLWIDVDERSEEHTSELQSRGHLVCRLLLEKKKKRLQAVGRVFDTPMRPLFARNALAGVAVVCL